MPETAGARLGTDAPLGITCSYPGNFTIDIANVSLVGPNVAPVPLDALPFNIPGSAATNWVRTR